MIKAITAYLCFLLAGYQQYTVPMHTAAPATSCTPPTAARWAGYDPANTCTGGCSNGNSLTTLGNFGGGNTGSLLGAAVYETGVLSVPTISENGGFQLGTVIGPTGTYYFTNSIDSSCVSASCTWVGTNTSGNFEWRTGFSPGKQVLLTSTVAVIATASSNATTGWQTDIVTFDNTTKAYAFYVCTSGSCTSVGSGTASTTVGGGPKYLGWNAVGGDTQYVGHVAEWGFTSTISSATNTAIATWSQCKYGV